MYYFMRYYRVIEYNEIDFKHVKYKIKHLLQSTIANDKYNNIAL